MERRMYQVVLLYLGVLVAVIFGLAVQAAHAQTLTCPAGGPGGAGGLGGITTGGSGGSARTDGFASASAPGGASGDASGGRGGSGGDAGLVVCNQNTNTVTEDPGVGAGGSRPQPTAPAPVDTTPVTTVGAPLGTLGTTGARTDLEIGLAGVLLIVGGVLVASTIDRRRRGGETLVVELVNHEVLPDPNEIWARFGRPSSPDNAAESHARRLSRAQRRQSIIRRPAPPDPYPHLEQVVEKWASVG